MVGRPLPTPAVTLSHLEAATSGGVAVDLKGMEVEAATADRLGAGAGATQGFVEGLATGAATGATAATAATAVAVEVPRITFLYKLVQGAADASFGLNVAQVWQGRSW